MQEVFYTYATLTKIMADMSYIQDFSVLEYIILGTLIFMSFLLVIIIIPLVYKMFDAYKIAKEKNRKRQLLHHITLQKEIEDQIEQEIREEELKNQKIESQT